MVAAAVLGGAWLAVDGPGVEPAAERRTSEPARELSECADRLTEVMWAQPEPGKEPDRLREGEALAAACRVKRLALGEAAAKRGPVPGR